MAKWCGLLSWWSGCLAIVVFTLGLFSLPSNVARADLGGDGPDQGLQCLSNPPPLNGCVNPGGPCVFFGQNSVCISNINNRCTCSPP